MYLDIAMQASYISASHSYVRENYQNLGINSLPRNVFTEVFTKVFTNTYQII